MALALGWMPWTGASLRWVRALNGRPILVRGLVWFWLALLAGVGALALTLQILGPPDVPMPAAHAVLPLGVPAGASTGVAAPIAALREPAPFMPGAYLPRVGADGRTPMRAYAAPFDASDRRPRIGVLLAGIGLNGADSEAAINGLPGAITLAFSPYGQRTAPLLEAARARGHEFLISLPLEPRGSPQHDAGNQALLVSATTEQNLRRLDWSLARIGGYVGATGALGALRGERFADATQPMRDVLQVLAGRGLLYVDPRPGVTLPANVPGRPVDLVIDTAQRRMEIERSLRQLEQIAREHGSALGLAGAPLPVTVGSIAAWAAGLEERGFVLAPITALIDARAR